MDSSKLYLILHRLKMSSRTLQLQRAVHHSSEALAECSPIDGRRYYHANRQGKSGSLYSRISPLGSPNISVKPELDNWADNGNKISVSELNRLIHDLRKRKRFSQALQISEWMNEKGICKFSPINHALQLDLIGRVHGFVSAESYFNNLPDEDKTEKTYGALLNCFVRQRQTEKSLSHLQKMKEMGFASSTITYNDIMCLYTHTDQFEKVPEVLAEMKQNKVSPDNYSYRICINSYGMKSDLEGMERMLKEMETQPHIAMDWNTYAVAANFYIKAGLVDKAVDALKKAEVRLDKKDPLSYNFLISLYAKLGKKDELLRLWELEKTACKRYINRDYINVLKSLVKLHELEDAEMVLKEWEVSGNCYDFRVPNIVIEGFCEKGWFERAEAVLENLMEKGKSSTPDSWAMVAKGYVGKGQMNKALETLKTALSLREEDKSWKPSKKIVSSLLNWISDNSSAEDTQAFVESLRSVVPVSREMYHALIKANIRDGKGVDYLLEKMKAEKIDNDEETRKILA